MKVFYQIFFFLPQIWVQKETLGWCAVEDQQVAADIHFQEHNDTVFTSQVDDLNQSRLFPAAHRQVCLSNLNNLLEGTNLQQSWQLKGFFFS